MRTVNRLSFALLILFVLSCPSFTIPVDPEMQKEINGLETNSYSITEIINHGKYFFVKISFKHKPSVFEASTGGLAVCGQVLGILQKHSMENDICVAVTSPTRAKGQVFFYGYAEYSKVTGEFEWKPYKG